MYRQIRLRIRIQIRQKKAVHQQELTYKLLNAYTLANLSKQSLVINLPSVILRPYMRPSSMSIHPAQFEVTTQVKNKFGEQAIHQLVEKSMTHPINQPSNYFTNQSRDQCQDYSTNQSRNQPTDSLPNQPTNQPMGPYTNQLTYQDITQPINQHTCQLVNNPTNQAIIKAINKSTDQCMTQCIDLSTNYCMNQLIEQPTKQLVKERTDLLINIPTNRSTSIMSLEVKNFEVPMS